MGTPHKRFYVDITVASAASPHGPWFIHNLKFYCCPLFCCFGSCRDNREGQKYYRVEGHDVKKIHMSEWLSAKPRLALFTRQPNSGDANEGSRRGKKRQRDELEYFPKGTKVRGPSMAAPMAEIIEVNDDETDEEDSDIFTECCDDNGGSGVNDYGASQDRHRPNLADGVGGVSGPEERTGSWRGQSGADRRVLKLKPLDADGVGASDVGAAVSATRHDEHDGLRHARIGKVRAKTEPRRNTTDKEIVVGWFADFTGTKGRPEGGTVAGKSGVNRSPGRPRHSFSSTGSSPVSSVLPRGGSKDGIGGGDDDNTYRSASTTGLIKISPRASCSQEHCQETRSNDSKETGKYVSGEDGDEDVQLVTTHALREDQESDVESTACQKNLLTRSEQKGYSSASELTRPRDISFKADDRSTVAAPAQGVIDAQGPFISRRASRQQLFGSKIIDNHAHAPTVPTIADISNSTVAISASKSSGLPFNLAASSAAVTSSAHPQRAQARMSAREVHDVEGLAVVPPRSKEQAYDTPFTAPVCPQAEASHLLQHLYSDQVKAYRDKASNKRIEPHIKGRADGSGRREEQAKVSPFRSGQIPPSQVRGAELEVDWKPHGKESGGLVGESSNWRVGESRGAGEQQATEDLTEADESSQGSAYGKRNGGGGGWASKLQDWGDGVTLTTIRGVDLPLSHFHRIVDSDGWLTSQVIY